MTESDQLRARWSQPAFAATRQRVLDRGAVEDAPHADCDLPTDMEYDLRGIDLQGAVLVGLKFEWLDHADLTRARIVRCRLNSASLSGTRFVAAGFTDVVALCCGGTGATFDDARFRATDFKSSCFNDSSFQRIDCLKDDWSTIRLIKCDLRRARFVHCDFASSKLTGSNLDGAVFEDCDLTAADLGNVSLRGARLLRCTMTEADWKGADLTDADVKTSIAVPR